MNKRIKAGWVKKLRSGDFKQGKGFLRQGKGAETKYCCLGVLTDMAVKNGVCPAKIAYSYFTLYPEVKTWAGLDSCDPNIGKYCASEWNDDKGTSFKHIADLIEKNL